MCGIAGVYRPEGFLGGLEKAALDRMLASERHRGPDGEGKYDGGATLLGHRRLAVIDLSPAAAGPMPNENDDVFLTYNGEIYNFRELRGELLALGHRFRSATDSEVLVHGYEAWGIEGLLHRLRGMFAFALWDARERRLFLARDRFGIKPLYYARTRSHLVFASELTALAASGLVEVEPSESSLADFLALGSIPAPETALRGVRCLPAAHYLEVSSASPGETLQSYWELPVGETDERAAETIPSALRDAIRMHLVSDVPLGVFLSGGIDSATLVAIASRYSEKPLSTLAVVFDDPKLDESLYARKVAETYGTDHHEIPVGASEFLDALPDFWDAMDQPTVDGVNAYLVSRAAREAGLTVVLTGLGGDEVFLGYPHFRKIRTLSKWLPLLRRPLMFWGRRQPRIEYLQEPTASNVYTMFRGLFAPAEIERLLPGAKPSPLVSTREDFLDGAVELEFQHYLGNQLLRDTDTMSMAHSIEARVPFLDHVLVEAALRVPYERKLAGRVNKPLLLSSLEEPLPREVWDRPKQGFTLPFASFLAQHRGELLERTLAGRLFETDEVRAVWQGFDEGRTHWSRPWALLSYASWRERLGRMSRSEPEVAATAASN
jgi:asparagine synthase (glutamine-hydrolysing)